MIYVFLWIKKFILIFELFLSYFSVLCSRLIYEKLGFIYDLFNRIIDLYEKLFFLK